MVALIAALWRSRDRRTRRCRTRGTERRMTIAVIGAVVATVLIISGFTIVSFVVTRALSVAGQDDLVIRVRG